METCVRGFSFMAENKADMVDLQVWINFTCVYYKLQYLTLRQFLLFSSNHLFALFSYLIMVLFSTICDPTIATRYDDKRGITHNTKHYLFIYFCCILYVVFICFQYYYLFLNFGTLIWVSRHLLTTPWTCSSSKAVS